MNPTEPEASKTVAARVKQQRLRLGWNMRQLAEATGLSQDIIESIENGRRRRGVTVEELMAFAEVFQVSPDILLPKVPGVKVTESGVAFATAITDEAVQVLRRIREDAQMLEDTFPWLVEIARAGRNQKDGEDIRQRWEREHPES